jgi:hypothetical protein
MAALNLVTRAPGAHLLFIALRDEAHQPCIGLGVPDQGARSKAQVGHWANPVKINLTFSLLISTFHLNFRLKLNILISFPIPSQIST